MAHISIIQTTLGSPDDAEKITTALLDEHLAACVQTSGPIISSYRWQGNIDNSREWRLTIKTTEANCPAVVSWLEAHHPYQTPEIIWQSLGCTDAYAAWCHDSVRQEQGE
ncbi:divalent-cation tolerance protein CutA [Mariprofundus erugo]|uniref:Divalent-cation tolerance protein CutA n=1 Tax=Mariprofundus erugo TaxID=2528639 RepID=A0A5R9GQE4_9PROT|nr:divalent-cation tolerance protein CutA [Mariprofundus erugo]TLS68511.1 divalent-cation tolerance protein CutA [Mariprofundus erugo]